jgi:hypothetical protein
MLMTQTGMHKAMRGAGTTRASAAALVLVLVCMSGCSGKGDGAGRTVGPQPPPEDTLGLMLVGWSTSEYSRHTLWDCNVNGVAFVLGDTNVVNYGNRWQQTAIVGYDRRNPLSITLSSRTLDSYGNRAFGHYRYPPQFGLPDTLHEICYRAPQVLECKEFYYQPVPGYGTSFSLGFWEQFEDYTGPQGGWPPTVYESCDTTATLWPHR